MEKTMEIEREIQITMSVVAQFENSAKALAIEMRVCDKVKDEKGYAAIKPRAVEMENKADAARELLSELEAMRDKAADNTQ